LQSLSVSKFYVFRTLFSRQAFFLFVLKEDSFTSSWAKATAMNDIKNRSKFIADPNCCPFLFKQTPLWHILMALDLDRKLKMEIFYQ